MANNDAFACPHCGKHLLEHNDKESTATENDLVIKSRLVFLNDNGQVLCKCFDCKKVVPLPLNFLKSSNTIQQ